MTFFYKYELRDGVKKMLNPPIEYLHLAFGDFL